MQRKGFLKHIDFFILDILVLAISYLLAIYLRNLRSTFIVYSDVYRQLIINELLSFIVIDYFYNPYSDILRRTKSSISYSQLIFSILQLALVTLLLFSNQGGASVSRLMVAIEYTIFFVLSTLVNLLWVNRLKKKVKDSISTGSKSLLIVTSSKDIDELIVNIEKNNLDFYRIDGLCVIDKDLKDKEFSGYKVVCGKDDLLSYACSTWLDGVYFNISYEDIPEDILKGLATMGLTVHLRLRKIDALVNQEQNVEKLFNEPALTSYVKQRTNKQIFRKELMDLVGGLIGSLITIILTIFIGPIIKIKSPSGPIFYKQERIGLNGRHFYMYKFRSMMPDADKHLDELKDKNIVSSDLMFKMEDDPRIIPGIGNFIRRTSLDEFPQFFNVLKGDMSLVGTRPPTVEEWEKYDLKHRIRMSIKPGITGLWQVSGRNSITDFDEVVRLDSEYIYNWHIGLDIKILLKTIKVLIDRKSNKVV